MKVDYEGEEEHEGWDRTGQQDTQEYLQFVLDRLVLDLPSELVLWWHPMQTWLTPSGIFFTN